MKGPRTKLDCQPATANAKEAGLVLINYQMGASFTRRPGNGKIIHCDNAVALH